MMDPSAFVAYTQDAESGSGQSGSKTGAVKKCKKQYKKEDKRPELKKSADACRRERKPLTDACIQSGQQTFCHGAQAIISSALDNIEYLQNCAEPEIQAVVIVGAGLVGVLLAYRRGWERKIVYGLVGSAIAYSVIFPKDAAEISMNLLGHAANIAADVYSAVVGDRAPYKCPESNRVTIDCPKKECKARARRESTRKEECQQRKAAPSLRNN